MNINYYKSIAYEILEYLKKARYIDWFKAYLCIHLIYGSVQLISTLFLLIKTVQNGDLLIFTELFFTVATPIFITTILSCIVSAFLTFMCFKYLPRLFVAFTLFKDILFSIILTIVFFKEQNLSLLIGISGIISFVLSLLVMFGFTYLLIRLVIRNIKNREKNQNPYLPQ